MSSESLNALFAEEHLSVSSVTQYIRCPRKYQFRYIDRAEPETRASALVFGSAIHEALAYFYSRLKNGFSEPSPEELKSVFTAYWKTQLDTRPPVRFGERETPESLANLGHEMLREFYKNAQRPFRVVEVEMPFSVEVDENAPRLVGIFDAVVEDARGSYRILEHKTAVRKWSKDKLAHDLQVTVYSMVASLVGLGFAPVTIQLLLKQKSPSMVCFTPHRSRVHTSEFIETFSAVYRAITAGAFWRNRDWHCLTCEYAQQCSP